MLWLVIDMASFVERNVMTAAWFDVGGIPA